MAEVQESSLDKSVKGIQCVPESAPPDSLILAPETDY